MSKHEKINAMLPFYASGTLEEKERKQVERHLQSCPVCQEELAFWQEVGGAVRQEVPEKAPPRWLFEHIVVDLPATTSVGNLWRTSLSLLKAQVALVRSEIWSASLLVMAIGFIAAVIFERHSIISAVAPMVAAAGIGLLYGRENDPAYELTMATPISQVQILLARLVLVFGYDLILLLASAVGIALILPGEAVGSLLFSWLAPMAFLSSLALLLSLMTDSSNAITATYMLWVARFVVNIPELQQISAAFGLSYLRFWNTEGGLYALSAMLLALTLWLVHRRDAVFRSLT